MALKKFADYFMVPGVLGMNGKMSQPTIDKHLHAVVYDNCGSEELLTKNSNMVNVFIWDDRKNAVLMEQKGNYVVPVRIQVPYTHLSTTKWTTEGDALVNQLPYAMLHSDKELDGRGNIISYTDTFIVTKDRKPVIGFYYAFDKENYKTIIFGSHDVSDGSITISLSPDGIYTENAEPTEAVA